MEDDRSVRSSVAMSLRSGGANVPANNDDISEREDIIDQGEDQ